MGIKATSEGKTLNIRARKGVILATGGSSSNVNFRRIFDPRLTEEYNGVAGEPYSFQDASGELAAIAIGASLWGAYNQVGEFGLRLTKAGRIGCQYGYDNLEWQPGSPVFHLAARARLASAGLSKRDPREPGWHCASTTRRKASTRLTITIPFSPTRREVTSTLRISNTNPANFLDAALAGTGEAVNGGGPIWAIFDADAVKREDWTVEPP